MVVSWNDSPLDDHDDCPANPQAKINHAVRLMVGAAEP
jgi:hypothetical protein